MAVSLRELQKTLNENGLTSEYRWGTKKSLEVEIYSKHLKIL